MGVVFLRRGLIPQCTLWSQNDRVYSNVQINKCASTVSWRRALSYRNQSIDLLPKLMNWLLYNKTLRHERLIRLLWLIMIKMEVETKWHRYDINRPRWGHGHRYSRYRKSLAMIMLTCIKKHLSNIWSWIHEKVN